MSMTYSDYGCSTQGAVIHANTVSAIKEAVLLLLGFQPSRFETLPFKPHFEPLCSVVDTDYPNVGSHGTNHDHCSTPHTTLPSSVVLIVEERPSKRGLILNSLRLIKAPNSPKPSTPKPYNLRT